MAVLSWRQRAALVKRYTNLKGRKAVYFLALTQGESSGDTKAYNGEIGTYGLWQIDASSHRDKFTGPDSRLFNPIVNVQVAEKVYRAAGNSFGPWAVRPNSAELNAAARALNSNMTAAEVAQLVSGIPGDPPGDWPTPTDPFGPFGDGLPDIPGTDALVDIFNAIKNALGWITEPHNWLRMATFVGGMAVLLLAGAALLGKSDTVKNLAMMAATKGRSKLASGGKAAAA